MGFINLFLVALMPVLKVILITGTGLFLALDRVNLLGPEARHSLNNLVFYVLGPALVVSNLAETITFKSFLNLWFMPVNIFITFIIGSALAWLLIKITRTPKHLQGIVIGCCSAGNLGNLLLIMIPAACKESKNPFGDSSLCSKNAGAYASLSLAIGAFYIWSYVYAVMRMYANEGEKNDSTIRPNSPTDTIITVSESCKEALPPTNSHSSDSETVSENCKEAPPPSTNFHGSTSAQDGPPLTRYGGGKMKTIRYIKMIKGKIELKKVFAPTAIAAIVGFIIGIISPIRKVLVGNSAPLRVIDTSAYLLGEAAIPAMTLILGANLLNGLNGSEVSLFAIIGILVVRNILLPILGICVVKAAHHLGLVGTNPLYQFVLMLQYAVPPATAVATISQFLQLGQGESSVILLWSYVVASFSLTLWSTLFMWLLA